MTTSTTTMASESTELPCLIIRLVGRPTIGQFVTRLRACDPDSPNNARALFRAEPDTDSATTSICRRRSRDCIVDPHTGLNCHRWTEHTDYGGVVYRCLRVTVSDAAEPEVVSDRAVLDK